MQFTMKKNQIIYDAIKGVYPEMNDDRAATLSAGIENSCKATAETMDIKIDKIIGKTCELIEGGIFPTAIGLPTVAGHYILNNIVEIDISKMKKAELVEYANEMELVNPNDGEELDEMTVAQLKELISSNQ